MSLRPYPGEMFCCLKSHNLKAESLSKPIFIESGTCMKIIKCCAFFFIILTSSGILLSKSRVPEGALEDKDSYRYVYNSDLRLHHPSDYSPKMPEKKVFSGEHVDVYLYSESFSQGRAVYAEIFKNGAADKKFSVEGIVFDGIDFPVTQRDWGCRAVFAISPEHQTGKKKLEILYANDGEKKTAVFEVAIRKHEFPYSRYPMDLGKYSNVDYQENPEVVAFIRECSEKKRKAFGSSGPDYMEESLAHPRDLHYVTSEFWSKRTIAQFKWNNGRRKRLKNRTKVHRGLDLRGKQGKPVHAMADGKVVLADLLYYEGNMVVIDHGNKIFSYYMHLDKMKVEEGQMVRPGQVIGDVGDTGISTAPHLHVSFLIRGVQVDPMSVLSLPLR